MDEIVLKIEQLSLNAWPSLITMGKDGWIIGLSEGYTRRANSVSPLGNTKEKLEENIKYCEEVYGQSEQETVFKLTSDPGHKEIDSLLLEKGYFHDADTLVQAVDIDSREFTKYENVELFDEAGTEWFTNFDEFNNLSDKNSDIHKQIVKSIKVKTIFAAIKESGKYVGQGFITLEDEYAGLYDVHISSEKRNKGYGYKLVSTLLNEAKKRGATKAFLCVMDNNPAAKKLYGKFGYRTIYRYWYMVK